MIIQKGRADVLDLHLDSDGVYRLPNFSLPPGPRYSLIDKKYHCLPAIEPRSSVICLPGPKESKPYKQKDCMPHHDYIDFGPPIKREEKVEKKPKDVLDPFTIFVKCIRQEIKRKKIINSPAKHTESRGTDISAALKTAMAIKLRAAGFDPIAIETSIRKKALRRGGRKHAKNGWLYDKESNTWFRTKTRPGSNTITIESVAKKPKEREAHYGSTLKGTVHVG